MPECILLVEDDLSLGETMNELLLKEGYDVKWSRTVDAAKKNLESFSVDIMVLDVQLPDGNGFDLAKQIQTSGKKIPIIFLTAQAGAQERLRGFELGAEEFIPKPFHFRELLMRLRHVISTHYSKSMLQSYEYKTCTIDFKSFLIKTNEGLVLKLSARDMALLQLLIQNKHKSLSRDEILDRLWGEEKFPSNRTVDNAIVRIRQAFASIDPNVIRSIRGIGYQWLESP